MPADLTPDQQEIWRSATKHPNLQTAMLNTPRDQWENLVLEPPDSLVNQFPPEAPPSGAGAPGAPTTQNINTLNGLQDDYRKKWRPSWSGLTTGDKVTQRQEQLDAAIPKWREGLNRLEPGLGNQDVADLEQRRNDEESRAGVGLGNANTAELIPPLNKTVDLERERDAIRDAITANDRMQEALGNKGRSSTHGLPEPPQLMSPRNSNAPVHTHLTEDQAGGGKSLITTPTSMTQDADGSAVLYPVTRQTGDPPASINALGERDPVTNRWTKPWGLVTDSNKTPVPRNLGDRDYYIPQTALENKKVRPTDLGRFPNPATTPFVVMHPEHERHGIRPGDYVTIYNTKTNRATYGIVGDKSGKDHNHIGEASLFTSAQHGNYKNPDASQPGTGNDTVYIFHAGSRSGDGPQSREEIQQKGRQAFQKWGGSERLQQTGLHPGASATGSATAPAPGSTRP